MNTFNETVEAANHTKSTQFNPPITAVLIITIATTTYPEEKLGNVKMEEFFTLDIVFTRDTVFVLNVFVVFANCRGYD